MESQKDENFCNEREYILKLESRLKSLQSFVDNSEAGMYVSDYYTGEVLYANRKTVALFGYEMRNAEEMFGKTCWDLINKGGKGRCPFCRYKELIGDNGELLEPHTWEHCFSEYGLWLKIISQAIIWTDGRLAQMNTFYDITETKRMQEELAAHEREKEQRRMQQNLQVVLDSLPVPIRIADLKTGSITYCNNAACALFDIKSQADVMGMSVRDFMPEVQPDGIRTGDKAKSLNSDKPASEQFVCYKPNGERLDLLVTACVIDYDGNASSLAVLRDIAEENRYQRMQQTLQEILDTLPIPVRITDQGTAEFVYVNKACAKMFGYAAPEEMYRLRITDIIPPLQSDGTNSREKVMALLRSNKSETTEIEYLSASGKIIDGRIDICFIEYNGRKTMLCIITDLSAEKEQRRLLKNAAEKEKEANKLKSSFLSNMSHEIRTPMNAIIGLTEIELRKGHSKESLETYKRINVSAKSLLQIVNDILDLSKIEADKLELFYDEFELEEVLNNALMVVSPRLEGRTVELLLDISPELPRYMIGDKTRLWQVLKNYLDNAAKFTQDGHIILSVSLDKTKSTADTVAVSFTVKDTGVGMDEEQLKKAFLPYEQVYNKMQNRYTGTGLGLPLSRRICELMGGTLTVESSLGAGTTIYFTLPFTRSERAEPDLQAISNALSGRKVLAVDNGELSLKIMEELLERCGADYTAAKSGAEALEIVRRTPDFDIILLDYVIGRENGIETAKKIRKSVPESSKLLLVTAYKNHIERSETDACGITDIIEKPFIPSLFFGKLLDAIGYNINQETEINGYTTFVDVRVLVFEDNDINQVVAEGILEQFGISAVFAENGKIGIDILNQNEQFDLILMDVHMPVMDGYEATRIIRDDPRFDEVPIISLTADAMTEAIAQCLLSGMNGYLSKPFEVEDFHNMLLKWLPKSKRRL